MTTPKEYSAEDITSFLALTNKIFNANLAQQNALRHQQMVAQIELAVLAKSVQLILDADTSEPQAIETLTTRILEVFDLLQSKAAERLATDQNHLNDLLNEVRAQSGAIQ